jgi:hypothetical protein
MGGLGLIVVFMSLVAAGEIGAVIAGILLERLSENASIIAFFAASVAVVALAWPLAVKFTETK